MIRGRGSAIAAALLLAALAVAGCGLGPGADVGGVQLTVTREFGTKPVQEESVDAKESDTVMRLTESNVAKVETRYGGGYVSSIEGLGESETGGDPYDWFFFVNGVESPVGAAEYPAKGGERIWWDLRNWAATDHVPAVVGSYPAPFVGGYEGEPHPVVVECSGGTGAAAACETVRGALEGEGVKLARPGAKRAIRVLVGPWEELRGDAAAAQIEQGPGRSGVYAKFERKGGGWSLEALDPEGGDARSLGMGTGLVAATRHLEEPPVWVVTGSSNEAVAEAAGLLDEGDLRDHYAVAADGDVVTALPVGVE